MYPLQLKPGMKIRVENRTYTVHSVDEGTPRTKWTPSASVGIETTIGTFLTLPANQEIETA
jgi:hypothetical protein